MIPVGIFKGKQVAVFGLGRSGLSACASLLAGGAIVHAWDDNEAGRDNAAQQNIALTNLYTHDWSEIVALVLSPGIPLTHPEPHDLVKKAKENGVEIIGDVELLAREIEVKAEEGKRPRIIAVTGTNGKSTTTALITYMLRQCGQQAYAGGNFGEAVLNLPRIEAHRTYVIEMSSYQIDLSPSLKPDVSVLLNISPDHLDRHGGMQGYVEAKAALFARQGKGDRAIVGVDDAHAQKICTKLTTAQGPEVTPIGVGKTLGQGVYAIEGVLYNGISKPCIEVADLRKAIALPGKHNWQNAAAAYAACADIVTDQSALAKAMLAFPGLEHRMEAVGTIGTTRFVNDSKATNAEATSHALHAYDDIYWIAGGVAKDGGIEMLLDKLSGVRKVYLIGEASGEFSKTLGEHPHDVSGDLETAIRQAYLDASASKSVTPVVLLSPACASFDQFSSFEARGDAFRAAVKKLQQASPDASSRKESVA